MTNSARKVYEYLSKVKEATKKNIINKASIKSEMEYETIRNELISKALVHGKKGRSGGLVLTGKAQAKLVGMKKVEFGALSKKAKKLWSFIPEDGRSVTNQYLRFKLRRHGVSYDDYYNIRKELLERKLILLGRGRGGTVSKNLEKLPAELPSRRKRPREDNALYQKIKNWLENDEMRNIEQQGLSGKIFSAVTASPSGYKQRSGRWSRPDVMLVSFNSYPRLIQKTDMTVKTYEIKVYDKTLLNDPAYVFEAASHQKGAHYSYLVIALLGENAKEIQGETEGTPQDLLPLLDRFGVGFAWFYKTEDGTYDMNIVLDAERQNPDPEDENEMVDNLYKQLPRSKRASFDQWAKG